MSEEQQINNLVNMLIERIFFPRRHRRRLAVMRFRRMGFLWRKHVKMQTKLICEWIPKIYDHPRNIILDDMLNE